MTTATKITVEIRKANIKRGIPCDALNCAIADRLKMMFKRTTVLVMLGTKLVHIGNKRFKMPDSAVDFAKRFDEGKSVEPIKFVLEAA